MGDAVVRFEKRETAAVVTLNRPDRRNALSRALIDELTNAFLRAEDDASIRSVILAGAPPAFCAGMDLVELRETLSADLDSSLIWTDALRLAQLYDRIYRFAKPTLAVVEGAAVAGGAGLVSVCDLAIATPNARFGYPEVRRGLVAAMVMPHLARHVGERLARYLLLTGELIDAEAAVRHGLVNEVVPADSIWQRAENLVNAFAAGGPKALAQTKALLARFSPKSASLEEGARGSAEPRFTEECQQGLQAFFAQEPPPWS